MPGVTTIGLDIAKSVFQVHGIETDGTVIIRRQLKRRYGPGVLSEVATVPGSSRGLRVLAPLVARTRGAWPHHAADAARLLKPYIKRQKNDAADAEAGIGPALATALVASIADPTAFRSGRDFSAWIGLVPKQHSSGGKEKLGGISKQGAACSPPARSPSFAMRKSTAPSTGPGSRHC